jgi:linoleoyl-CoA desaturase
MSLKRKDATVSDDLKFEAKDEFHRALRQRVDRYFADTGKRRRDCWQMYLKTAVIFSSFAASYLLLLFYAQSWWLVLLLSITLGLSMAGIGFNIQHDGGHQAYSSRPWVNRLMASTLDLLGGSSYFWARKHNKIHHSYSNIDGHDDDIDIGFFGRLAPYQRRLPFHRFQHFYLWILYGFLPMKWQLYDDFHDWTTGRVGGRRFARPRGWGLAQFITGRAVFFSLAFVVPMLLHPVWAVLLVYLAASMVQGVAMSVVFQMAHCVEIAAFPLPSADTSRMESTWAVHQVETTVDFARGNRVLSWFIGGLNFQIEHHLFPRICHIHYAAIAPMVEETCGEFGLTYLAHRTFREAIASHFRWLRRMGMPAEVSRQ